MALCGTIKCVLLLNFVSIFCSLMIEDVTYETLVAVRCEPVGTIIPTNCFHQVTYNYQVYRNE